MDKARPDDSAIIDEMEGGPSYVGSKGGNVRRERATRLEVDELLHGAPDAPVRPHRAPKAP